MNPSLPDMEHVDPEILTAEQLAKRLQLTTRVVEKHVSQKTLPFHKIGRNVRFNLFEVLEATKVTPRKF